MSEFYTQYAAYGTRGNEIVMPVIEVPDPEDPNTTLYYFLNKATAEASAITVGEMFTSVGDLDLDGVVLETFYDVPGEKVGLVVGSYQTKPSDADIISELTAAFG